MMILIFLKEKIGANWTFGYDDLMPFYEISEKVLGVAGMSGDPSYPTKIKNLLSPVKLNYSGIKVANAFNNLKWHWWPSYSGIITEKKKRKIGSLSQPNNTFWPEAIKNGVKLFTKQSIKNYI